MKTRYRIHKTDSRTGFSGYLEDPDMWLVDARRKLEHLFEGEFRSMPLNRVAHVEVDKFRIVATLNDKRLTVEACIVKHDTPDKPEEITDEQQRLVDQLQSVTEERIRLDKAVIEAFNIQFASYELCEILMDIIPSSMARMKVVERMEQFVKQQKEQPLTE